MTEQASDAANTKRERIFFYLLCAYLIGSFLVRILVVAHEYPGRSATILDMAIDAGSIVGLLAIRNNGPKTLRWIAIVAGLGLFAIRLNGDASWWTGHLFYSVP